MLDRARPLQLEAFTLLKHPGSRALTFGFTVAFLDQFICSEMDNSFCKEAFLKGPGPVQQGLFEVPIKPSVKLDKLLVSDYPADEYLGWQCLLAEASL